jgi:hypothetical protein
MREVWFKFFARDWAGDAQLNRCSLASREVWKRMTFLMREAEPFGFFVGRNGEPIDIVWFAREVNATLREVKKCILQLETEGVFSKDSSGRIYSRRMVRERARQEQFRQNGSHGGNPALLDNQNVTILDNQNELFLDNQDKQVLDNPSVRPRTRTRIQKLDTDSLRSSALAFRDWPQDIAKLRELALVFVAAFGNCLDPVKAERYVPHYTGVLAQMRSRGVSLADAWQACADGLEANGGKPLFAAAIKSAMSFLPARASLRSGGANPLTPEDRELIAALEAGVAK